MSKTWQNFLLLLMHIAIGGMASFFSGVVWLVALFPLFGGAYNIIRNKNLNNEAVMWAAYCVGAEVFLRMTGASLTYEIGKYSVLGLLMLGLLVEKRPYSFGLSVIYLLCLLPALFLIDVDAVENVRKHILFNLSGPICLFVALWYFNNRMLTKEQVEGVLLNMLLPVTAMSILILIKTPDFSSIKFTAGSNFTTSGGFGPNQVATQLGLGILILGYCLMFRIKLFPWKSVTIVLLIFFTYRGALTLSRGGIIGAAISLFLCALVVYGSRKWTFMDIVKVGSFLIVMAVAGIWGWNYVDRLTAGQLYNRYTGKDSVGQVKKDPTSGRERIFLSELDAFMENPISGIGLGMGKLYRKDKLDLEIATHNEFGRMLGEHGLLGVIDILIMIAILVKSYRKKQRFNRISLAWLVSLSSYAVITMGHSALRIALPSFLFGMAIAYFTPSEIKENIKKKISSNENNPDNGYLRPGWSGAGGN